MSLDRRTLRVEFSTEAGFRSEYLSNISNGGVFIATSESIEVRDPVVVELELGWCGEHVQLEGEVVHRIGEEMAASGAVPGVAVQFDVPARELRERFHELIGKVESDERVYRSGRRAAPRTPARIRVRVQMADGAEVVCRTRDISASGLLLSVDGWEPRPIGEELGLVVAHPRSGEQMEVNAAVVRHVSSDAGEVVAMGVEFRTSSARRTEVANFVNEVRAADHGRRLDGITGPIAELGIENLLQMFGASSPRGVLTVSRGVEEGVIVFDGGELHTARLGRRTGAVALREMLSWREGGFEFQKQVEDGLLDGPGEGVSLAGAILNALCEIDEESRADAPPADAGLELDVDADFDFDLEVDLALEEDEIVSSPEPEPEPEPEPPTSQDGAAGPATGSAPPARIDPAAKLAVDRARADAMRAALGEIEQAVLDLALVGMSVARMVEVIPEPEIDVYRALDALQERGILTFE